MNREPAADSAPRPARQVRGIDNRAGPRRVTGRLGGPLGSVAATTTKLTLSLMHLAVGAALIPTLGHAAGPRR